MRFCEGNEGNGGSGLVESGLFSKFKNLGGPQVRSINLIDYYTKRLRLCNKC